MSIALVEKAWLPRFKPCGGIFPRRLGKKIAAIADLGIDRFYDSLAFSYQGDQPVTIPGETLGVIRSQFDEAFARRAMARADGRGSLIEEFEVSSLALADGQVFIGSRDGRQLRGDVLIAADGAFSPIARMAGLNTGNVVCPAIDTELSVADEVLAQFGNAIHLDLFEVEDGYGWIFPKADRLSCGVLKWSGKANLNAELESYLKKRLAHPFEVIKRQGHGLPIYTGQRALARDRVLLAGDAANLVEPIYGAGIEAAVESGILAGQAALAIIEGDCAVQAMRDYEVAVHRTIGDPIAAVYRQVSPLFCKKPAFFYRNFIEKGVDHISFASKLAGLR